MKHIFFHTLLWSALLSFDESNAQSNSNKQNNLLNGQQSEDTLRFDLDKDLAEQLIPLDEIYAIALRNAATLSLEDASITGRVENIKFSRFAIFDGIKPFATFLDGNQTLSLASGAFIGDNFQLTTGYRYGITAEIPLAELFGRKNKLKIAKSELDAAQARRRIAENEVKKDVIEAYFNLTTNQKILKSRINDELAELTAFRVAEIELQQGKITPEVFSRINSNYINASIAMESARGNFLKSFYTFEVVIGASLSLLKKK